MRVKQKGGLRAALFIELTSHNLRGQDRQRRVVLTPPALLPSPVLEVTTALSVNT